MNDFNFLYLGALLLIIIFSAVYYFIKKTTSLEIKTQCKKDFAPEHNLIFTSQDTMNIPLTIQKVDNSILKSVKPIETNRHLKSYSNEILRLAKSNAPYLSKGKEVYEVVFSESIQKEIKNGSIKMLDSVHKEGYKRAMAVNNSGKIIENANLKRINYNPAQIKALAMNTLTVVVSQEHLKEIRKELESIQQSLNRLISMEKNKYYGQAQGAYDYLQRAYNMYLNEELNERVMNELESIYRENISSIRSISRDLEDITSLIFDLKKEVWIWQTSEQLSKFKNIVEEYNDYEELLKLCFMNVNGCIKLMELYGDSQSSIDYSISTTNNLLKMINGNKKQFILNLNSYSEEFKTKLSTNSYYIEKQQNIKQEINNIDTNENMYIQSTSPSPPEKIYLTVENEEVVSVHRI